MQNGMDQNPWQMRIMRNSCAMEGPPGGGRETRPKQGSPSQSSVSGKRSHHNNWSYKIVAILTTG